jgi:hypothetical protein
LKPSEHQQRRLPRYVTQKKKKKNNLLRLDFLSGKCSWCEHDCACITNGVSCYVLANWKGLRKKKETPHTRLFPLSVLVAPVPSTSSPRLLLPCRDCLQLEAKNKEAMC